MESQSQQKKSGAATKPETSLRCCCGSLLARIVAEGVELKCRRCKRQIVVPIDAKGAIRIST